MDNCIIINNQRIELTEEQVRLMILTGSFAFRPLAASTTTTAATASAFARFVS